ncbi:MAG: MoaD/ThiS family protein [Gordonia sp. (in: high G+C Gram-positive bacteria)]
MSVTVSIPTILRTHTGGAKRVEVTGATLAELIDNLDAAHPGIKERLVTAEANGADALHRFVNIYVNDEDVRFSGGLTTTVDDGDEVTILPAVAGG